MIYLISQVFVFLLIAALLGILLGWYLTRMSMAGVTATLETRVRNAERDARDLRRDLEFAVKARTDGEASSRQLSAQLEALSAEHSTAQQQAAERVAQIANLEAALQACHDRLGLAQAEIAAMQALPAAAEPEVSVAEAAAPLAAPSVAPMEPGERGAGSEVDDLQLIKGIGPKIAATLHTLGVTRFEQIAGWHAQEIDSINDRLRFKGRVEREKWVEQARELLGKP